MTIIVANWSHLVERDEISRDLDTEFGVHRGWTVSNSLFTWNRKGLGINIKASEVSDDDDGASREWESLKPFQNRVIQVLYKFS